MRPPSRYRLHHHDGSVNALQFFPEFDPADLQGDGHESPEDAARGDVPERFAQVVHAERADDASRAVVVIETNEPPLAWEQVFVAKCDGRWFSVLGGGGLGRAPRHAIE